MQFHIDDSNGRMRLDRFLADRLQDYSRTQISAAIVGGLVRCNGARVKPSYKLAAGDKLVCDIAAIDALIAQTAERWEPAEVAQAAGVELVYEDAAIIVADKPPGLAVHPGAGHAADTLANHLLLKFPELQSVARAGIVHRLDLDTSGLLVIARTEASRQVLVADFAQRSVSRRYRALVIGEAARKVTIAEPIGRHKTRRTLMAVRQDGSPAITHWQVRRRFGDLGAAKIAELDVVLETGRTHQIRVHTAHAGHPVLGDATYTTNQLWRSLAAELGAQRQMLHAAELRLQHPKSGEDLCFTSPLPEDYLRVRGTVSP